MKKNSVFFIVVLMLLSLLMPLGFVENVKSIDQHETSSGTVTGYVAEGTSTTASIILRPNANGDVIECSSNPGGRTNYQCVDETVLDTVDNTMAYIVPSGTEYDLYQCTNPNSNYFIYAINNITIYSTMKCSFNHAGTRGFIGLKINSTENWTSEININTNWIEYSETWAQNPHTLNNWTWINITDLQLGFKGTCTGVGGPDQEKCAQIYVEVNFAIEGFDVTRTVYSTTESNNFSFYPGKNYTNPFNLRVPVSNDVAGIVSVTNNSAGINATEVNAIDELVNNTFWYDTANQYVYIRTINLTSSVLVNWNINCSYGATFNIHIPTYKEVGEDIIMSGTMENSSGSLITGITAKTHIYYSNGTDAITPIHKWNLSDGNYFCSLSTTSLLPGIYTISIEFTDSVSGITFKYGNTLYLSWSPVGGVYSDAIAHIGWYNTNFGLGLPDETLQLYVDGVLQYALDYYTYIGATINVTVRDYYNSTLYSNDIFVDKSDYPLFLGLTFHEYDFTNTKDEYYIVGFLKTGANRWYERIVAPNGQKDFLLPSGNYTIRVYNSDNSSYISWIQTVDRSRGYLIAGNNITQVIEGQSVIRGQILEFDSTLDNALMPDANVICRNPPIVFSAYNPVGMMLGGNYITICPPINVIAQTRNTTTGNWIDSTALIPSNGTTANGSISILEDIIYFSIVNGTVPTWINITYTSNGTLIQNTSYIPTKFYPEGFNVTINASCDIQINRETRFNQLKQFYWDVYTGTNNPGWITESNGQKRVGYHRAGLEISNTMSTIWYDVYVYAGFSPDSSPDLSTVRLTDVDNDNTLLEEGEDYKATSGVEFKITGSLDCGETRSFLAEYYSNTLEEYYYGSDVIHIDAYQINKRVGEKLYNYFEYTWINSYDRTYRGPLSFYFDFEVITGIKQNEFIVYDVGQEQNITDFIISDQFLQIGSNAVGDVNTGGGKTYKVYFKFDEYLGQNVEDLHLTTQLTTFLGVPISIFIVFMFIGLSMMVTGVLMAVFKEKKTHRDYGKGLVGFGLLFVVIIWFLSAMGV